MVLLVVALLVLVVVLVVVARGGVSGGGFGSGAGAGARTVPQVLLLWCAAIPGNHYNSGHETSIVRSPALLPLQLCVTALTSRLRLRSSGAWVSAGRSVSW